jgi:hypothetical protein
MAHTAESISSVLAPESRGPFKLIAAIIAGVAVLLGILGYVERMVDGRIEIKLAAQKQQVEDHEKRLGKIEEKLGGMSDVLSEIRADVKVLRVQMERK